jgi:hypothetical protein
VDPAVGGGELGVRALVTSPSGTTIYVAGDFTSLAGLPRAGLGAISSEGIVTSWNPGTDGSVLSLAVGPSGSPVYVGGYFTALGGQARSSLGAVTAEGALTPWDPSPDGLVQAIAVDGAGSTIYIGGQFPAVGGHARSNLAAVSSTGVGDLTDWNVTATGVVRRVVLSPDGGVLYVGGAPGALGGLPRAMVGALTTAGTGSVTAWDPQVGSSDSASTIGTLQVDPTGATVYIGGRFDTIGGQPRSNLGAVSTTGTGAVSSWDPSPSDAWREDEAGAVDALSVDASGSSVAVGGGFEKVRGVARDSFAQISTTGQGDATAFDIPVDLIAAVEAMARRGSTLYVGGTFTRAGTLPRRDLAAVDLDSHTVTAWAPELRLDAPIFPGRLASVHAIALDAPGTTIYVGGEFDHANGLARGGLVAISTTGAGEVSGQDLSTTVGSYHGVVLALALDRSGSRVFVGGNFRTIAGVVRHGLAAVSTNGGDLVTAWNPPLSDSSDSIAAFALDPAGARLFVGGSFNGVAGVARSNLAAVTTSGAGSVTEWDPGANAVVEALAFDGGNSRLYAGGQFAILGGAARGHVGAVTTAGIGSATPWNPSPDATAGHDVYALALSFDRSEVYVGGYQSGPNGANINAFSSAGSGADSGWTPAMDRPVAALLANDDSSLFVGSWFNDTGVTTSTALAEFAPSSPLQAPTVDIGDGSVAEGDAGMRHVRLTVSLSKPSPVAVSVYYESGGGPATAGKDYLAGAGWVTIPAGATSAPVSFWVRGDGKVDPDEFFRVKLSSPEAGALGRASGVASINDDDVATGRRVSVGDGAVVEGDSGARQDRFEVSLSRVHAKPVTVTYVTKAKTASVGSDFAMRSGTVTIPAGEMSTTLTVPVQADTKVEPNEVFAVTISKPVNAVLGRTTGTGRILDDD